MSTTKLHLIAINCLWTKNTTLLDFISVKKRLCWKLLKYCSNLFILKSQRGFWVSISYRSLQSLSLKVAKTINNIRAAIKMKQIQNSHGFQKVSNISKLMHPKGFITLKVRYLVNNCRLGFNYIVLS